MLTKDLIKEKIKNSLPGYTGKPDSFLKRHAAVGLLVFIILAILFGYLIYQRFLIIKQEQKKEAYVVVEAAKEKLQEAFTNSLLATKILSFFIDNNGAVKNFDSVAAEILSTNKNIDVLQLVPDGIIRYVYPLQGNEAVIGYNILKDAARNKEAFKAIQKRELFFSGPFELKQGGFGIVGRLPVFRNGKFWGFSAVVIKMTTLLNAAEIDQTAKSGYYYQLSKINPDTKKEEFFIPHVKRPLKNYLFSLDIPFGDWKLSVEPVDVNKSLPEIYILALIGFLFSIFGGIFVFEIFRRPEKLERLVKERTSELKGSENKYRSVIDRVSDAFVSLDKDWNYTFVNKKAGEIFARKPETLIGKNIWTEFPEWKDQPFYHVYYRAMETQTYQYLEEYYPAVDKWFESHVYPSNNGLTFFFKDVTEIKQVMLALKNNEEKYRTLIEQASDGIVITDLAGEILEVNNSIKQMLGYAGEEMIGYPLTVFLPDDDIAAIPLRINELMQGKSLMYERRLLKKDGTVLDVEINSKMASSHTLIGFIREITQRIKISADLKKSIERYELIAAATNDVIWDHDFENNITWGNKSLYQLYGVEAGTTAINFEMFISQIHPDDREGIKTRFEEAVKNRQSSITEEFRFKNAEGEYRIFYDRAFIKYDDVANPERILGAMQDITEAEKVKKQIIKEKELSDSIINSLPGVFYLYNKEGKFLRWNKNFETVTGYTGKEIAQMHPLNFFDDTDQELLTKKISNVFVAGRDEVEADFLLKNKEKILYFFTGQAIEYEGQTCLMGVGIDFSERKKAVVALHNSEQKYRLLFYNNPLPMWMTTIPDLDIIGVNEAAIKHYGYTREEFLKLNAKDLRPAEDVDYFVAEVKKMKPGINNTRAWRHKKKDGTIIHVEIYSHEIFYEGQRVWLGLSHDITEKYEAKEQLQKSYEDIRQLAANLQSIREDERTNIAREIHDELGQQLTGLKMDLHWLTRKINSADEEVIKKMKESVDLINATISSVRKIATELRPSILDDLGLLAALEWQGEEFEKRSGTKVKFINEAGDLTVKPAVATAIFRIYQELLTNIARHANAALVTASLYIVADILYFSIKDDGNGFNLETISNKKTLGLLGIKERTILIGGTYEIKTKPGEGSETIISIPVKIATV